MNCYKKSLLQSYWLGIIFANDENNFKNVFVMLVHSGLPLFLSLKDITHKHRIDPHTAKHTLKEIYLDHLTFYIIATSKKITSRIISDEEIPELFKALLLACLLLLPQGLYPVSLKTHPSTLSKNE